MPQKVFRRKGFRTQQRWRSSQRFILLSSSLIFSLEFFYSIHIHYLIWNEYGCIIYALVSQDGLLLQISSISEKLEVEFADGVTQTIPASYVEFFDCLVLPQFKDLPLDQVLQIKF